MWINFFSFFQLKDDAEGKLKGMLDHSRMALCMFMLSVLVFNPFGFVVDKLTSDNFDYKHEDYVSSPSGRVILNASGKLVNFIKLNFTY